MMGWGGLLESNVVGGRCQTYFGLILVNSNRPRDTIPIVHNVLLIIDIYVHFFFCLPIGFLFKYFISYRGNTVI